MHGLFDRAGFQYTPVASIPTSVTPKLLIQSPNSCTCRAVVTAEVVIAECGSDMTAFPTSARLASWAGICPGNRESAGKRSSGHTRPVRSGCASR